MNSSSKYAVALKKVVLVVVIGVLIAVESCTSPALRTEQAEAQTGTPVPHVDSIELNGSDVMSVTITHGDSVIVRVQAKNVGSAIGYRAGIYASFPEFDSYGDADYVDFRDGSEDLVYFEHRPGDPTDRIWYDCGAGNFGMPQELLVGGYEPSASWNPGDVNFLEVKVRPPRPGTYQIYVKAAMADSASGDVFYQAPTNGECIDQQCQYVYRRTIEVRANPDMVPRVYIPAVFNGYRSTPLRGVRMQAPSCSTTYECSQRLNCLESAGVNTVYYTVYHYRAYYHGSMLPHQSFDSLACVVREAHARGMAVYALLPVAGIGWPEHPQWNARLNHTGVTDNWLDFTVPEARSFVADVAQEIVMNYDVDGILLDYIRWQPWFQDANLSADDVSLTVQGVYERVKATRPVRVTASVFKSRWSGERVGQMWYDWLSGGYVDYVTPMAYVNDTYLQALLGEWRESGEFPERIIPRLSVVWFEPTRPKNVGSVLGQIDMCYDAGVGGVALWDDRYVCRNLDLVEMLGAEGW